MITKTAKKGSQIEIVSLDMLVPEDHLLGKIDEHINFSFIYDLRPAGNRLETVGLLLQR